MLSLHVSWRAMSHRQSIKLKHKSRGYFLNQFESRLKQNEINEMSTLKTIFYVKAPKASIITDPMVIN